MKRTVTTGGLLAIVAALAAPAAAADLPQPVETPIYQDTVPQARYDWTGIYFGGLIGWQWSNFDNSTAGVGSFDTNANGVNGGVVAGYNYQFNPNFVLGIEGDFTFSDIDKQTLAGVTPFNTSSDWNSNIRARAGWVFDRYMFYGAGGLAIADISATAAGVEDSTTKAGWTVGAGVEGLVTQNVTARLEYLYQDFGSETFTLAGTPYKTELNNNIVRFGMSYKF